MGAVTFGGHLLSSYFWHRLNVIKTVFSLLYILTTLKINFFFERTATFERGAATSKTAVTFGTMVRIECSTFKTQAA